MPIISPPRLEQRPARPCVGIRSDVAMAHLATALPPHSPELLAWLAARGQVPAGPAFWRYLVIDTDAARVRVESGFPVVVAPPGDGRVVADTLPGGSYAVALYSCPPDGLMQATGELLQWAQEAGIAWDMRREGPSEIWSARIEWYLHADPIDEAAWSTELAFLTR